MTISAIAAVARNGVIGEGQDIPWRLPTDMAYFMRTTKGRHVIMGRKTYDSMGKPLANRTNIVLTRDPYFAASGVITVHTIGEALEIAYDNGETEAFIIGGGDIYRLSEPYWDRLYLTVVDAEPAGDTLFPDVDLSQWRLVSSDPRPADERNDHAFDFRVYERDARRE